MRHRLTRILVAVGLVGLGGRSFAQDTGNCDPVPVGEAVELSQALTAASNAAANQSGPGDLGDVVHALDQANVLLENGYSLEARSVLIRAAEDARTNALGDDEAFYGIIADILQAQANGLGATNPDDAFSAAYELARHAGTAGRMARGETDPARKAVLQALHDQGRIQASLLAQGASNTNVLLGKGISQTYRQIVAASFDHKIANVGFFSDLIWGTEDELKQQKARVLAVFDEIDRTIEQKGISFGRAWHDMFDDNYILKNGDPLVGARYATRNHAAQTLRDHEITRGLLMPFADLSDAFSAGDTDRIDESRARIVEVLRDNDQWEVAGAVLEELKRSARSRSGEQRAAALADNEGTEWFKAKASQFIAEDLPILVLSGVVSGGLGWGAKAGVSAIGWGTRAAKGAQIVTEIATFVPTERVLSDVINGKKADWSAAGLGRDYALTIAGYGLFKAIGSGWKYVRTRNLGKIFGSTAGKATRPATQILDDLINAADDAAARRAADELWGRSAPEIAQSFEEAGYKTVIQQGTKGSGRSIQIRVEGHPTIANIQVHPGGGRHAGAYYKISTSTKGKIKVVDPGTYRATAGEKVRIVEAAPEGRVVPSNLTPEDGIPAGNDANARVSGTAKPEDGRMADELMDWMARGDDAKLQPHQKELLEAARKQGVKVEMSSANMADPNSPYRVWIDRAEYARNPDIARRKLLHELAHAVHHRDYLMTQDPILVLFREMDARMYEGMSKSEALHQTLFYYRGLDFSSYGFHGNSFPELKTFVDKMLRARPEARDFTRLINGRW